MLLCTSSIIQQRFFHSTLQVFNGDRNIVKAPVRDTGSGPARLHPPVFVRVDTVSTEIRELRSADGRFRFLMLEDRNVVVRQGERLIWQSGSKSTHNRPVGSPFRLVLQNNGNLVAYDADSRGFWSSNTAKCGPRPYRLTMQDDGYCVLYDGSWVAHWTTSIRSQ